jgi:hypothetical protein
MKNIPGISTDLQVKNPNNPRIQKMQKNEKIQTAF